jgi:hypothetical protein
MTQIICASPTTVRVMRDGKLVTILPLEVLTRIGDADLDSALERAQSMMGYAVTVPSFARVPRPRHSVQHGIAL